MINTLLSLILSGVAMAQNAGVTKALKTGSNSTTFSATLQSGYHFNEKAPNLLKVDDKRIQPFEFKKQSVKFKIPSGKYKSAQAALYICDDANTFCEPRHIPLAGSIDDLVEGQKVSGSAKKNSHGFIETTLEEAQEIAKKEKKLILVDFSARWCPGCVRLEQEVFGTKEFKAASKNLVKLKLDVDRFENVPTKKEFEVAAIPTLIVLTADLKEISRIVDYQPTATVAKFLTLASDTPLTFEELKTKVDAGDMNSALMLGQRQYNAGQFSEAAVNLAKVTPEPIELLDSKVQAAKKKSGTDKNRFQKVLREALAKENTSSRSLLWRSELAQLLEKDDAEKKKLATEGITLADALLADDQKLMSAMAGDFIGEFAGFERLLVALHREGLARSGGLSDEEVKAASIRVAEIAKELKIPISRTGPSMRYLLALVGARDWAAAETQARKLLARDPKNPELQRRLLRILNENKKYSEAVKIGKAALAGSYGKNEIWVVQQLAKSYAGNKQRLEARALIQSYLERPDIDWSLNQSEKEDLQSQLARVSSN